MRRGLRTNAVRPGVAALVLAPFCLLWALSAAPVAKQKQVPVVVTIDPPCPVLPAAGLPLAEQKPVPVEVRYNPAAQGARLTKPASLSIELAFNGRNWTDNQRSVPMVRGADGVWTARIPVEWHWHLVLFYVKDEGERVDNNDGKYWEILGCGTDGAPTVQATERVAATYIGDVLAPGIGRAVDYARAIRILEEDMSRHPERIGHISTIWDYRARREGRSDAVYAKLAGEIDRFLTERKQDKAAVVTAADFVWRMRTRFPDSLAQKTRAALVALDPDHPALLQMEFRSAGDEKDPRRRLDLYTDFLKRHPDSVFTQYALAERFYTASQDVKDVEASEAAFEDWLRFKPDVPDVYASMGRYYVQQKTKLDRAVELLTKALELCRADAKRQPRKSGAVFQVTVGCDKPDPANPAPGLARLEQDVAKLRQYRGEAFLQKGEHDRAIADLESATRVFPDDWKISFSLAQACERAGRKEAAYAAYLQAATVPHQTSREPAEALERLFITAGMGTKEELESRVDAAIKARRKKIAADFKPSPVDREAPAFNLTTLDGKRLDNAALRGRPLVLSFWATWCGPCVAEMPGFVEFQNRHPEVTVIAVAMWSEPPDVPPMVQKRKWQALNVAISDATGLAFGVNAVPQTFVLDKAGRIRFVHSGGLEDVVTVLEKELALLK